MQQQQQQQQTAALTIKPVYYGWYCPAIQQLRLDNPSGHAFRGRIIEGPPYSYYATPDGRRVLVTEITNSSSPTERQIKNGDIFLGEVTTYCGRSYNHREAAAAAAAVTKDAILATRRLYDSRRAIGSIASASIASASTGSSASIASAASTGSTSASTTALSDYTFTYTASTTSSTASSVSTTSTIKNFTDVNERGPRRSTAAQAL